MENEILEIITDAQKAQNEDKSHEENLKIANKALDDIWDLLKGM